MGILARLGTLLGRRSDSDPRTQLREARARVEALQARRQTRRLQQQAKLLESAGDPGMYDWANAYADLLNRYRNEPYAFQPATIYDRRYGRNYPVFQTETELALIRGPARVLLSTNTYAQGILRGLSAYVIGDAYTYRAAAKDGTDCPPELVAEVQEIVDGFLALNNWCGTAPGPTCDKLESSLEKELLWRTYEDGEAFWDHVADGQGDTRVRTIEPEQVTQMGTTWTWEEGSFGVLTPRDDAQEVLDYHVFWGDNPAEGEELGPERVSHVKRGVKRSIKRGLSEFSFDTYDALELANKVRRAMGSGAAIRECIVGVREHQSATQQQVQTFTDALADYQKPDLVSGNLQNVTRYQPGQWIDIPQSMKFVAGPSAVGVTEDIQVLHMLLRAAGTKWNAPEWLATASGADMAAYTAALTAESPFVRYVQSEQSLYKGAFSRSVWIAVRNKIEARGTLTVTVQTESGGVTTRTYRWEDVRELVEIQVEAPTSVMRDKLQEAQRKQIELQANVTSRQQWAQEEGYDWDRIESDNDAYEERHGPALGGLELPPDEGGGDAPPPAQ
jgi:hypothetical protein